jgi:hypothetical protein
MLTRAAAGHLLALLIETTMTERKGIIPMVPREPFKKCDTNSGSGLIVSVRIHCRRVTAIKRAEERRRRTPAFCLVDRKLGRCTDWSVQDFLSYTGISFVRRHSQRSP